MSPFVEKGAGPARCSDCQLCAGSSTRDGGPGEGRRLPGGTEVAGRDGGHGGVSSWRAMRRALLRTARAALETVIVARETAWISPPTLNASRTLLPRNCAGNCGRSIEKLPYGSW